MLEGVKVIVSAVLTFAAVAAALPADVARGPLLLMAVLYPASALLVQRRFGSGWLPTAAATALVAFAAPMAAGLPALAFDARLAAVAATLALLQMALPLGFATAAIWRLERRAPAAAVQLAGGVAAYLAAIPLATAATAAVLVALAG